MGVYQSVTEPKVGQRGVDYLAAYEEIHVFGEKRVLDRLHRMYKIPRKVKPFIEETPLGKRYRFEWWDVETFN